MISSEPSARRIASVLAEAPEDDCARAELLNESARRQEHDPVYMLALSRQAIDHASRCGDEGALALAHRNAGAAYRFLCDYPNALRELDHALELYRRVGDRHAEAAVLININVVHFSIGDYERAIGAIFGALSLSEELGDMRAIAAAYNSLGNIRWTLEQYENALADFDKALEVASALGDDHLTSSAKGNLGLVHISLGNNDRGLEYLRSALEIEESGGDARRIAEKLAGLGYAYSRTGQPALGLQHQLRALEISTQLGHPTYNTIPLLLGIARTYMAMEKPGEALPYATRALEESRMGEVVPFEPEIHSDLADIHEALGNLADALLHHRAYARLMERDHHAEQKAVAALQIEYDRQRVEHEQEQLRRRLLETEHQAVRAQINPHFLSNALNCIQYFLTTGDSDSAHRYLSRFATLIRMTLELARKPMIPLEDEVTINRLYLELEELRFGERLSWRIAVDDALDTTAMRIPPMLLQPLVENAIRHGILPSGIPGRLLIEFRIEEPETLLCIVEDNGIGRRESLKRRTNGAYGNGVTSLGTSLIEERLNLLGRNSPSPMTMTIIDLQDPAGTRVEIRIPVKGEG